MVLFLYLERSFHMDNLENEIKQIFLEKLKESSSNMKNSENEVKQILLAKLKEMSEISFNYCETCEEYAIICNTMNEIAKTLLDKTK